MKKKHHIQSPVVDFTHMIRHYGPGVKYFGRVLIYYVKFLAFEPFRYLEKWVFGKRIREHRFNEDPVFILGYYRSGTTHLQEVLAKDPQFGFMNFYQCYFSRGFLVTEKIFKRTFGRIMTWIGFHHPAHRVPFKFDMPGEEDVCMVSSGFRLACSWGQIFPEAFEHFFDKTVFFENCTEEEKELFAQDMDELFRRVSIANDGKRLVLKSPPQTGRLKFLKERYPNAKFIFIRRNPYYVFKSNQKLWQSFHDQALQDFTRERADDCILWSFNKCMERYEAEKSVVGENQLVEVNYEDFQEDPVSVLEKIYRELNLPGYLDALPHFARYLAEKHGSNIDRYTFSERDLALVRANWDRWIRSGSYDEPVSRSGALSQGLHQAKVRKQDTA